MEAYEESGITFKDRPWGKKPGFDLRWKTPLKGLMVGGSLMPVWKFLCQTQGTHFGEVLE
jgi:hypothetical protein